MAIDRPVQIASDELAASLQQLTNALAEVFWVCGVDRRQVFFCSPAFERIWGRNPAELFSQPLAFLETIHPADRQAFRRDWDEQIAGIFRPEYSDEFRIVRPDGEIRSISSRYVPVRDEHGHVTRLAGVSTDCTDQKANKKQLGDLNSNLKQLVADRAKKLREAEQRLRTIIQHEPECVKILDAQGTLLDVNPAGLAMFEAESLGQVQGQSMLNLVAPEYHAMYCEGLATTIRGEKSHQSFEIVGLRGTRRWMDQSSALLQSKEGGDAQIVAITRDVSDRVRAEESLRFQAEILRQTHDAVIATDLQGRITHWNRAAERDTEYLAEEVLGKAIWFLWPKDALPFVEERVHGPLLKRGSLMLDGRVLRKSGEIYSAQVSLSVLRDPAGVPVGFIGSSVDVTDRMRTERQLQMMNFCIDHSSDAILWIAPDAGIHYANAAACERLGYTQEELLKMFVFDFDADLPATAWPGHWDKIKQFGSLIYESRHRAKDGRSIPVEINANYVRFGGKEFNFASSRDITERKRSETALIRSERMLREVLNSMHVFVGLANLDGMIVEANQAAVEAVHSQLANLIGRLFWDIYPWSYSPPLQAELQDCFGRAVRGAVIRMDVNARTAEGEFMAIDLTLCPVRDAEGHIVQIVASGVDITERIRIQEQVHLHREELTHALRVSCLGEMAAGIAHELNQPLMAIASYAERLRLWSVASPVTDCERMRDTVKKLGEQSVRAGAIVRRLRGLVLKSPSQRELAEINPLVARAIDLVAPNAHQAEVTIDCILEEPLPPILIDVVQIEQVLINLLRNSIDAIDVGPADSRAILVQTKRGDDGTICISVSDSGPGIPPELAAKVFEAFFSTKGNGLGMGLAISRSIIEAHGASLELDQDSTTGTRFRLTLPSEGNG